MPQTIREVMTKNPKTVSADSTATQAARIMRDSGIGDVIVVDGKRICGIVTDRDITVRAVAEGKDPSQMKVTELCSRELVTLKPDDPVDTAVKLMRDKSLRRVPIVEGEKPVGVVSIGDLAIERDPGSALADISAAPSNR